MAYSAAPQIIQCCAVPRRSMPRLSACGLPIPHRSTQLRSETASAGGVQRLPLSLTIDHRAVDAGPAVRFPQAVARPWTEPEQFIQENDGSDW